MSERSSILYKLINVVRGWVKDSEDYSTYAGNWFYSKSLEGSDNSSDTDTDTDTDKIRELK